MGFDQQAAVQFGAHVAPAVQRGEDGFHRARVLDVNVKALWHSFVRGSNPVSVAGWGAASGEGVTAMTELVAGLTLSQGLRSEEHTSELHHVRISYAVFCLKKKKKTKETMSLRDNTHGW